MGSSSSANFPTTAGAYDPTYNSGGGFLTADIVVARLSPDGTALIAGTYVGGTNEDGPNNIYYNYGDGSRGEVYLDDLGNVYVGSTTSSFDFPATAGAYQETHGGGQDGCVFKMTDDLSTMLWATYLGGAQDDGAYAITVNEAYEVFAVGGTGSNNFPVTAGVVGPTFLGGGGFNSLDGFVAKLSADGSSLDRSTYIATNQYDQVFFVELDGNGDVSVSYTHLRAHETR